MAENGNNSANESVRKINRATVDTSEWPHPDIGALSQSDRALYLARKRAIQMFLSGQSQDEIFQEASLGSKQAYRLVRERCLAIHPDGQPYGWRALIPYLRVKSYQRRKKIRIDHWGKGGAGAMQMLLDRHPDLRAQFDRRILAVSDSKRLQESKKTKGSLIAWIQEELRKLGYEARGEWPFNTASKGYSSFYRYINAALDSQPKSLAYFSGGPDLVRKLTTGDGTNRPVMRFMQRVEMDAHKIDGRFCVSIPQIGGGTQEKIVHRLWVTVLVEVVSRVVLGYYLTMRKEVSKDDVLRAIKMSLSSWKPKRLSFSDQPYKDGAGFPSKYGPEYTSLCWDETSVDGALAETCKHVKDALRDAVKSTLLDPTNSFAIRRSKDDRPFIEAYFRTLAGRGFQRLSNSTGGKPQDRKGKNPEDVAITSRFQVEYAEELLEVMIANYNASPHSGIGQRTPLGYFKELVEKGNRSLRHADENEVEAMFSVRMKCRVRGGASTGRAPYVEVIYARYSNQVLHNRQDLVGSMIWVVFHKENDCRIALATTLQGESLGVLRAAPPWHLSPHSLSVRSAIAQANAKRKFLLSSGPDAIENFINYVESQPSKKLPVHPAYLEARQILIAAAEQFVGTSMLDAAKARAAEEDKKATVASSPQGSAPLSSAQRSQAGRSRPKLPPRRMASTEQK